MKNNEKNERDVVDTSSTKNNEKNEREMMSEKTNAAQMPDF